MTNSARTSGRNIWRHTNATRTNQDHAAYAIYRAMFARSNIKRTEMASILLQKHFTSTTNQKRIDSGWHRWKGLELALRELADRYGYFKAGDGKIWNRTHTLPDQPNITTDLLLSLAPHQIEQFVEIATSIYRECAAKNYGKKHVLYLFTRDDLSKEQQLVQTAHAAFVAGQFTESDVGHDITFVVCSLDGDDIESQYNYFNYAGKPDSGIGVNAFYEPDLAYAMTSFYVRVHMTKRERENMFGGCRLLMFDN